MTSPPWMRAMASGLNRLVALDPEAERILGAVSGLQAGLTVTGMDLRLLVRIDGARLAIEPWPQDLIVDVEIAGPPASLFTVLRLGEQAPGLRDGTVSVRGDAAALQALRDALSQLDLDLEEWLASHTGDVIAHQAGNLVRGAGRWWRQTTTHFSEDLRDYLITETGQLGDPGAVEQFVADVDATRDDVERLEQRVARLERKPS